MFKFLKFVIIFTCINLQHSVVTADQDPHAGHSTPKLKPDTSRSAVLKTPDSGKARELGFDNKMIMEHTGLNISLSKKCELATRGIIMVDRDTLKKCKP